MNSWFKMFHKVYELIQDDPVALSIYTQIASRSHPVNEVPFSVKEHSERIGKAQRTVLASVNHLVDLGLIEHIATQKTGLRIYRITETSTGGLNNLNRVDEGGQPVGRGSSTVGLRGGSGNEDSQSVTSPPIDIDKIDIDTTTPNDLAILEEIWTSERLVDVGLSLDNFQKDASGTDSDMVRRIVKGWKYLYRLDKVGVGLLLKNLKSGTPFATAEKALKELDRLPTFQEPDPIEPKEVTLNPDNQILKERLQRNPNGKVASLVKDTPAS